MKSAYFRTFWHINYADKQKWKLYTGPAYPCGREIGVLSCRLCKNAFRFSNTVQLQAGHFNRGTVEDLNTATVSIINIGPRVLKMSCFGKFQADLNVVVFRSLLIRSSK